MYRTPILRSFGQQYYIFLFLLILSSDPYAKEIYVSPDGNDSNSGTSPQDALATMSVALFLAEPGDEIRLLPGTYLGKTIIQNTHGAPEAPITIMSDSEDSQDFAVIDGGSQPGVNLQNRAFELYNSSWITFLNLKFRNCWTDVIVMSNASYISVIGCDFRGGRRVIYPQGTGCHHFLAENCYWEQHEGVWTTFDWEEMHHGSMAYYNGALFHPSDTGGSYVFRGNTIKNVFNAFRSKPYLTPIEKDGNGELYDNTIMNVADNDFEPEVWAWNIHYYHNRLHNIHKMYSIDDVKGGPLYIYGNVITESKDANAIDKVSGIWKFKNGPLTQPCYGFNNSYYTEARVMKGDEATNQQMKHFNNAYFFFQGSNRFELNGWQEGYEFDYDCINQSWPPNIVNNNQEQHGFENTDVLFIDGPGGDLRLQRNSPCVDAGKVVSFPEFDWTQSYIGNAPDIGAYEGDQLVEGPPFRYREPPGGDSYYEKPRIVRHYITDNQLTLYFSLELDPSTVSEEAVLIFLDDIKIPVSGVSFPNNNYEMVVFTERTLNEEKISFYLNPLPIGVNGEAATHWASTIKVARKELITSVNYAEHKDSRKSIDEIKLQIYPNPFNTHAIVKLNSTSRLNRSQVPLLIYDTRGRLVKKLYPSSIGENLTYRISSTGLASGIYFAVFRDEEKHAVAKFSVLK